MGKESTIRKGFFFYFGLFILLLVAVFLVCLVIMMFNPGTTILWMKYFTGNETIHVTKLSDGGASINYANIQEITIKCDYANVTLQANEQYTDNGIYIVNRAKGFSGSNGANFEYKVTQNLAGTALVVEITEPTGFLYFSTNIEVIISSYKNWSFGNLKLNVNATGKSDVYLGTVDSKNGSVVMVGSLDIYTEKGSIYLGDQLRTGSVSSVKLATNSGKIKSFNAEDTMNTDVSLTVNTGRINFEKLNVGAHKLDIKNTKGSIAANTITASTTYIDCVQGNFVFGKINGDISFEKCTEKIISPNITIDEITGDFNLTVDNSEKSVSPDAYIKKISGDLNVIATSGDIKVDQALGKVSVESDGSLTENITVAESNTNKIVVLNGSGAIKLNFAGNLHDVDVKTTSGKITLNFTTKAGFTATARKVDGTTKVNNDHITISIDKNKLVYTDTDKADLVVGSSPSGVVKVRTDLEKSSAITYNLVEAV